MKINKYPDTDIQFLPEGVVLPFLCKMETVWNLTYFPLFEEIIYLHVNDSYSIWEVSILFLL